MKKLIVLLLISSVALAGRENRLRENRRSRPFGGGLALLEAFTASGAGTTSACSTTAPTGSRGEALTFARAGSATCTKTSTSGYATTGIADGDLVTLGNNVARVEYTLGGELGLRREGSATNLLLRSDALTNAAWSDVGTPGVADGATDPFGGTTGDTITDNDGAAFEGRSQSITVSAGAAHILHCYLKAGTSLKARLSLDGTTGDVSTLSTTTWTRFSVSDASSSGTSIAVQVLVGNAAGDTGSVIFGGCGAETGARMTSYIITAGSTVARVTDGVPTFPVAIAMGSTASVAISITTNYTPTTGTTLAMPPASGNPSILGRFNGGNFGCYQMTAAGDIAGGTWTTGSNRWSCSTARSTTLNGTTGTGSASTITATISSIGVGSTGGFGESVDGIYSRWCVDTAETRCSS
jgi:hypothetical protein